MLPVKALLFDVFGTVVDWRSSVVAELQALGNKSGISPDTDWRKFAEQWRSGYLKTTLSVAKGAAGPTNVDVMHRGVSVYMQQLPHALGSNSFTKILDDLLASAEWASIGAKWDEATRADLNLAWHRLNGWPDSVDGLHALKKQLIIATLSNGNLRLLVDMAKHAGLPWDTVFSTELFHTFKPNPTAYLSALHHLALPPDECAMVAAHIYDLRAAAGVGMRTVYVPRPDEDWDVEREKIDVKAKKDGGEVDLVVSSFVELAEVLAKSGGVI